MDENNVTISYHRTDRDIYFNVFYCGILALLTLINIPGNMLVITTILRHEHLRQPGNYLLVSLAFSDLLMGCVYPIYNTSHMDDTVRLAGFGEYKLFW